MSVCVCVFMLKIMQNVVDIFRPDSWACIFKCQLYIYSVYADGNMFLMWRCQAEGVEFYFGTMYLACIVPVEVESCR